MSGRTQGTPVRRRAGAPPSLASTPLRTLAWMRHLLDRLHEVRDWAAGKETPPSSWSTTRAPDAAILRKGSKSSILHKVPERLRDRRALLLDETFGPVFAGRHGGGGDWFSDKLSSGKAQPSGQRLRWLNQLAPRSALPFLRPPAPFDPWFYDALDFQSPWFGRLFLWRAADPDFEDAEWTETLGVHAPHRIPPSWRKIRLQRSVLEADEKKELEHLIEHALTVRLELAFFDESPDPNRWRRARERLAQSFHGRKAGRPWKHPVAEMVRKLDAPRAFIELSNAIAAYRTADLAKLRDRSVAAWWLRGALDGARGHIRKHQRACFYTLPNREPPLEGVLRKLGLASPRAGISTLERALPDGRLRK